MPWLVGVALMLLLAVTYGFLALLLRYNIAPKAAVRGIVTRLWPTSPTSPQEGNSAPYHRIRPLPHGVHRPLLLNLETSDGSGQACHPDVTYIAEGFGANRWTYWMACTPYPFGDAVYENPELFASQDGIHWIVPLGLTNPLVPPLKTPGDHNSDPDILFKDKELWLFYRETQRSKSPNENKIYLIRSADAIHWSTPVEVLRDNTGRELLSPSVIYDGTHFVMWTIEVIAGKLVIVRRQSDSGTHWSEPTVASINGVEPPRSVWHIDVIQDEGRLSAILVSCLAIGGAGAKIHYASSEDGGLNWSIHNLLLEPSYEFEAAFQYRASLLKCSGNSRCYDLWYTAASKKRVFSIAYLKMVREGNKLLPRTASQP